MDKKAVAGDTLVYIYSIISLAAIAILFSFLFIGLTHQKLFAQENELKIESPNIELIDTLNYLLFTKIKANNKETSLSELIPLYCKTPKQEIGGYAARISDYLLPEKFEIRVTCIFEFLEIKDCNELNKAYKRTPYPLGKESKSTFISSRESLVKFDFPLIKEFPDIDLRNFVCLEIINKEEQYKGRSPAVYQIPLPQNKVKSFYSVESFKEAVSKAENKQSFISPSKDLWIKTEKGWCNPIEKDCFNSVFISTEKLISCSGDYPKCK